MDLACGIFDLLVVCQRWGYPLNITVLMSSSHNPASSITLCLSVPLGPLQPNPSNKLAIIHILGLLSNLFTTLDISKQDDESGDGSAPPVKTTPPPPGPNPVSGQADQPPPLATPV